MTHPNSTSHIYNEQSSWPLQRIVDLIITVVGFPLAFPTFLGGAFGCDMKQGRITNAMHIWYVL